MTPSSLRDPVFIESVNMSLRKITKNRGSFPSDEALLKLFYLAIQNISKCSPDAAQRNPGISRRELFPRISFHCIRATFAINVGPRCRGDCHRHLE